MVQQKCDSLAVCVCVSVWSREFRGQGVVVNGPFSKRRKGCLVGNREALQCLMPGWLAHVLAT